MNRQRGLILDLDGTLYKLSGSDGSFGNSDFYADLKRRMQSYLGDVLGISSQAAKTEYDRIKSSFNGEVSIGVERELGISRLEWFANTWNLNPKDYIEKPTSELVETIKPVADRSMVLTAAPAVWAYPALSYLGLDGMFEDRIVTGEPDIRKPSLDVFRQAADLLQRSCCEVVSIGDQDESDILPAKALGMVTIKVGLPSDSADYSMNNTCEAVNLAASL